MGPCPSGHGPLTCPLRESFYNWIWLDSQLILPPLGGEADTITISGFSGGGVTANNLGVVWSESISGIGMTGSGPYGDFMSFGTKDLNVADITKKSVDIADYNSKWGFIDNTSNLKDTPVFISSGKKDVYAPPEYQFAQRDFY